MKESDEHLPSGSVIYWSKSDGAHVPVKCGRCRRTRSILAVHLPDWYTGLCRDCGHTKHLNDITLSNGSIIFWSQREGKYVPVRCGRCRRKRAIGIKGITESSTGICFTCSHPKRRDKDKRLSSGSTVHWSEREDDYVPVTCGRCGQKRPVHVSSVKRGYLGFCRSKGCSHIKYLKDMKLDSGSVVHWSERSEEGIPITCGKCGRRRVVQTVEPNQRGYKGHCPNCKVRKYFKDQRLLPSKSIIHWSEREGDSAPVTCGKCGTKRIVHLSGAQLTPTYTGLCLSCSNNERKGDETRVVFVKDPATGEKKPVNVAVHWSERDPDNEVNGVGFNCVGCGEMAYTRRSEILRKGWRGLCSKCREQLGNVRKRSKEETLHSGSVIYWNERDKDHYQRVKVKCGMCGEFRYTGPPHDKEKLKKWSGWCKKHFQWTNVADGNSVQNGVEQDINQTYKTMVDDRHPFWIFATDFFETMTYNPGCVGMIKDHSQFKELTQSFFVPDDLLKQIFKRRTNKGKKYSPKGFALEHARRDMKRPEFEGLGYEALKTRYYQAEEALKDAQLQHEQPLSFTAASAKQV